MKKCAFTICSNSYLGIAETLRNSFLEHNLDADFIIIIADYFDDCKGEYIISASVAMNLDNAQFLDMAFKYNVTEFCTAIKPYGFDYLFSIGYDRVVYLDPDIMVFSSLDAVWERNASIYLTPHITKIQPKIKNTWTQEFFLKFGIFNCGFVGISNDTNGKTVVNWWKEKLYNLSFADTEIGIYTDQKWMEYVFNFINLEDILVINDMGYDLAPWNFSERKIINDVNGFLVVDREYEKNIYKLCFVHYSTFNYIELINNGIVISRDDIGSIPDDMKTILECYRQNLIANNALAYLSNEYKYMRYDNGEFITKFHRRIYRQLRNEGRYFGNPFSVDKSSVYYLLLKSGIISRNRKEYDAKKTKQGNSKKSYKKQEYLMRKLLKIAFRILGEERYLSLLRGMHKYSRYENNCFLLKEYNT